MQSLPSVLLCAAALSTGCAGQNLTAQGSFVPGLGGRYGGGFITDDSMYMVIDAETYDGRLMKFPITRDSANGNKIDSVDFTANVTITSLSYMDVGWHDGIGDTRWWNTFETEFNLHWGTVDGSNNQYTEIGVMDWYDIEDKNSAINYGIYGSDDHPSLTSTSGKPYLYVTSRYLLGRISLNDDDTVDKIETLGKLPDQYPGDLFFVPSGDLVGSVIIPGYNAGELWAVELNDQGLCLDSTDSTPITPVEGDVGSYCKITVLIDGLTKAWGMFNDPVTNDLFVASWGVDALTPVYGLPPGCDFQVVIAQLESILLELTVLVTGRRLLLEANLFDVQVQDQPIKKQQSKADKKSKSSKDVEKEIADQESIKQATVTGILSGDLSGADSVTNQLTTTFSNQSFSNSVGGDSGALITAQENFEKVQGGLKDALAQIKATVVAEKVAAFEVKELEIAAQLDLLKSAVQLPAAV